MNWLQSRFTPEMEKNRTELDLQTLALTAHLEVKGEPISIVLDVIEVPKVLVAT
jgi:hypothetical protein